MQHTDSYFSPDFPPLRPAPPTAFQVLKTNEHGMVLESVRSFEVGSTVALGFHVDCGQRTVKSKFISVEAIVVGSIPSVSDQGMFVNEVTLMFSEIDREDRAVLLNAPEMTGTSLSGEPAPLFDLDNCLN